MDGGDLKEARSFSREAGMWWNVLEAMPCTLLGGATFKVFQYSLRILSLRPSATRRRSDGQGSMMDWLGVGLSSGLGRSVWN